MRNLLELLWEEWKIVEQLIAVLSDELERIADADAGCSRIQRILGIGPIVTTAIAAAIGKGAAFRKGREFAAWAGTCSQAILHRRQARSWAGASAATPICARSWSMAPRRCSSASSEIKRPSEHGWMPSN